MKATISPRLGRLLTARGLSGGRLWHGGAVLAALLLVGPTWASAQITVESRERNSVPKTAPDGTELQDASKKFSGGDVEGAAGDPEDAKKKKRQLAPPRLRLARKFFAARKVPEGRPELD